MPNFRQSIITFHSAAILIVTVPGNITPIVVTLLSVQSKLSFTLVSALCTPPQSVHSNIFITREIHATVSSWGRLETCDDDDDDDDHFLRGQLLASDEFRPHHPETGEQSAAYVGPEHQAASSTGRGRSSLYSSLSLPGPEPGHTWPWRHDTDTGPTWIQTPGPNI